MATKKAAPKTLAETKEVVIEGRPHGAVEMKPAGISVWSNLKFFFQLREYIWSIPVLFFLYYFTGVVLAYLFGWGTGFYDPSFVQPLFLAGLIVNGAAAFAQFIAYFYFRSGIHRYFWGIHKSEEQAIINYSKLDFKSLTSWQRLLLAIGTYCFFVFLVVLVFLKLV